MDVTRTNFKESLPIVAKAIEDSTFLSLDTEFSGLTNGTVSVTNYDSPEDRYQKIRSNTGHFAILQFGLCAFKLEEGTSKYTAQAFNFYIFPFRANCPGVPDRVFSCQSSSIDFLSAQNFDFNKVFREGIPYLKPPEEALCRSSLAERHMLRKSPRKSEDSSVNCSSPCSSPTPISDQRTKSFVDSVFQKIDNFLRDSSEASLSLDPCNSYLRKILYETIPKRFDNSVFLESRTDEKRQRYLVVIRACGEDELKQKREEAKARDDALLEEAIGFSKVIQLITGSQKLILGHNCLLDIVYSIQQFISNVPPTLDEFKALVSCVFPRVIDTKLMGSMLPFKESLSSTTLCDMYLQLQTDPFGLPDIEAPDKYSSSTNNDSFLHEAGYDAFITGASFLGMLKFLHKIGKSKSTSVTLKQDYISPYCNKLFMQRSPDIPYLNLSGADLTPTRSHVFHIQFPPAWKTTDIRNMFAPVTGGVQISWINDTQCFVGLYNKSQVGLVRKLITQNRSGSTVIKTYEEYQKEFSSPKHFSRPFSQNKVWLSNNSAPKRSYSSAVSHNLRSSAGAPNPLAKKLSPVKNLPDDNKPSTSSEQSPTNSSNDMVPLRLSEANSNTEIKSKVISDRKRHGSETEDATGSDAVEEPKIKRQRSQECLNKDVLKTDAGSCGIAVNGSSKPNNGFEVPETW